MPIKPPRQGVSNAILWEAALCFSWLNCDLIGDPSWPTERPYRFAAAVLGGATVALLLYHVVPAVFARDWCNRQYDGPQRGPLRYIGWILKAWFSIGAAASAVWLAQSSLYWVFWGRLNENLLNALGTAAALLIGALVLAAKPKWQTLIAGTLALLAFILIAISAVAQSRGLSIVDTMVAEASLGDNVDLFKEILFATAPASIFALRLGTTKPSVRVITYSGILGMWLPIVSSTILVALAKVGAVRLYWKPTLPINGGTAFAPILFAAGAEYRSLLSFIMAFVPLLVSMSWVKDLLAPRLRSRKSLFALAIVGIIGLSLTFSCKLLLQGYYAPWCWSILCASYAYACRPAPLRLRRT